MTLFKHPVEGKQVMVKCFLHKDASTLIGEQSYVLIYERALMLGLVTIQSRPS